MFFSPIPTNLRQLYVLRPLLYSWYVVMYTRCNVHNVCAVEGT